MATTFATLRKLAGPCELEIEKIKGSRFIAFAQPVADVGEALAALAVRQREHAHANHHCFAWRGQSEHETRTSDDGEPRGSAGQPILRAVSGRELFDVVVIVTRYFGGTKLGIGGLIRAYGGAAGQLLDGAEIVERARTVRVCCEYEYGLSGPVAGVLAAFNLEPQAANYGDRVYVELDVPDQRSQELARALLDATSGSVVTRLKQAT